MDPNLENHQYVCSLSGLVSGSQLRFKLGTSAICQGSASQMAEALQFWGSEVVSSRVPGGFMGL